MVLFVRKRAAITIWNIKAVVTLILVSLFTWLHLLRKALGTSLGLAVTLQQPLLSLEQTTGFLTTSADLYALDSRKSEGKKDLAHTKLHGLLAPPERAAHPLASERVEWSSGYPCPQNLTTSIGTTEEQKNGTSAKAQASDNTRNSTGKESNNMDGAVWDADIWTVVEKRSEHEPSIAICALIRNEESFLDEWIAFHWLQGVRKFILYDDCSSDKTCQVLQKYVQRGIVDYRKISEKYRDKPGVFVQMRHLNNCLAEISAAAAAAAAIPTAIHEEKSAKQDVKGKEGNISATNLPRKIDWVLLSDVDEYAFAKTSPLTLTQALQTYYSNHSCVHIYRKDFGTSGHFRRPAGGLLIENYILSAPTHRRRNPVKLLINVRSETLPTHRNRVTNIPHPHGIHQNAHVQCADHQTQYLQMNQYLRSLHDFDIKINTNYQGPDGKYLKNPLMHFWDRDRNEVVDDSAPRRYACAVRNLLAYWTTTVIDVEKTSPGTCNKRNDDEDAAKKNDSTITNGTTSNPLLSDTSSPTDVSPFPPNEGEFENGQEG